MLDNLILSLNTVTPVLLLTLLGMLLKKIKLLPDSFYSGADKFVFDIALPALIFVQIVGADLSGGGNFMRLPLFTSLMLVFTCTFFSVVTHFTVKDPARVGASVQGMFPRILLSSVLYSLLISMQVFPNPIQHSRDMRSRCPSLYLCITSFRLSSSRSLCPQRTEKGRKR